MLPRRLKTYSTARRKLLLNFVQEQADPNRKDSLQSGSTDDGQPKVYELRESRTTKYFEDENDTEDFSPDCSEYIPSPERKSDSRSTSSLCTDLQDSDNIISTNKTVLHENDNNSTSSLGGDSLVIDNMLRMENIAQSPSAVSNLSLMLGETDFVASPTVIFKKTFSSPKKQRNKPQVLLDVTLTPGPEHEQLPKHHRAAITNQSASDDLEKTLTPIRPTSSDLNETNITYSEIQDTGKEKDNDEVLSEKNITTGCEMKKAESNNVSCDEENNNKTISNNLNQALSEDREKLDVEELFVEDSIENVTEHNTDAIINLDHLGSIGQPTLNSVSDADNQINLLSKKLTRKRKADQNEWRDKKNKKLKNSGLAYEGARNKKYNPCKNILPNCTCKKDCWLKFNAEERLALYSVFYKLANRELQWQYITRHVKSSDVKKVTVNRKTMRNQSLKYYFPQNNEEIQVCKVFFLNTLSITEQMVYTALEKIKKDESLIDKRGKHDNRPHQMTQGTEDTIRNHINLFPKVEAHYTRKESKREYLCEFLNISKMYRLYKTWFAKQNNPDNVKMASKRQYEKVFNTQYNLSFFKPKKDQCSLCSQYQLAETIEKSSIEENYRKHLRMKERVREIKKEEKETLNKDDTVVAIFDLEKVLNVPQSEVSIFHYKRKYPIYNFTVFDALNKLGFCYVWQAQIGKKGSIEIGSCLYQFIKTEHEKGIRKFIFYSDGCYGQNKNRYIFALYLHVAINLKIDITHRFLVGGHSQNEGDSMHACIERALKNKVLYTPDQVYSVIMNAKVSGEKYTLKEMQQSEILNIKELVEPKRWLQDKTGEKVRWSDVMEVSVTYTKPDCFLFKYDYDQDYIELDYEAGRNRQRRQKQEINKIESIVLRPAYNEPLPIRKALYNDLISLCNSQAIPTHYQLFYKSLSYCSTKPGEDEDSD